MPAVLDSLAYHVRWARRAWLCHWRNRFPRDPVLAEKAVLDLHRRQKEDFQVLLREECGAVARLEANRRAVEARLALLEGPYADVLEIGCENGWFGRRLIEGGKARRVTGVDLRDEEMRGHARPGAPLLAASAERLPFKDGRGRRFDLVAAFHVLEHIRDPESLRRELARLAAPSAQVILAVPLGYDEDPCHRWHYMTPAGWKGFLKSRFGLDFLRGGVHLAPDAEFLGLFRFPG
jgi:SAM-dependent methyltransferase